MIRLSDVKDHYRVTVGDQSFNDMTTEETAAANDEEKVACDADIVAKITSESPASCKPYVKTALRASLRKMESQCLGAVCLGGACSGARRFRQHIPGVAGLGGIARTCASEATLSKLSAYHVESLT
jgi:hypothetical protein